MNKYFEFIKKVKAISHIGLTYSKDEYALENYEELKNLSEEMLGLYTNTPIDECDIYKNGYYPTPQASVRTLVIKDSLILFVKEKDTGTWSVPGGWCDIDTSPSEAAIMEIKQESGYDVKINRLLAVMDRSKYYKSQTYDVYNVCFLAEIIGGEPKCNHETCDIGWFSIDKLPELSFKNTEEEIKIMYDVYINKKEAYFD